MNSDRRLIVKMLALTIWEDKINQLLNAWSCVFLGHWIEHFSNLYGFSPMWLDDCGFIAPFALFWLLLGMCFDVISEIVCVKTHNRIVCNCVASAHCEWACAFSDYQLGQRTLRILNSCVLSPHCGWSCASLRSLALDTSVCSFFALGQHVNL